MKLLYTPMWHDIWKHTTYEIVVFVLFYFAFLYGGSPESEFSLFKNILFGIMGYIIFYKFVEPSITKYFFLKK